MRGRNDELAFTVESLRTIRARTLIVQGDRDPFYPVALSVDRSRAIPDAALSILPNAGHVPIFGALRNELVRQVRRLFATAA